MFKTLTAAVAALALTATPALAQTNAAFVGPRVEATVSFPDVADSDNAEFGVGAGYDFALSDRVTFGLDADVTRPFSDTRVVGAGARLGAALNEDAQAFARVGYERADFNNSNLNLEGLAIGGGLQFRLTDHAYATTEYRYTDFDHGVGAHGLRAGLGFRF